MRYNKNIYEIVEEQELSFVLSSKVKEVSELYYQVKEAAVCIHLFYLESIYIFLNYLTNIPANMDKYISVSTEKIKKQVEEYIERQKIVNCRVIVKENRGRDISALLVAFRPIILQYKYFCFVHDKRTKNKAAEQNTKIWIRSMWDNTLVSKEYIHNVLNLLEKEKRLGLLVPPEIPGMMGAYIKSWEGNYSNTLELSKKLNLNSNISKKFPPITYGTVFWCKTDALNALLTQEWVYEDFQIEPLPDDNTISHAIERIIGYVAQSEGFDTGYLLSEQFAQSYVLYARRLLQNNFMDIEELQNENWDIRIKYAAAYMNRYERVFFYGAGEIAGQCYNRLAKVKKPDGFLVSQKTVKEKFLELPVYTLDEIKVDKKTGIIVTVGRKNTNEIVQLLEKTGITNYITLF